MQSFSYAFDVGAPYKLRYKCLEDDEEQIVDLYGEIEGINSVLLDCGNKDEHILTMKIPYAV